MKKFITLTIIIMTCAIMTGCGKSKTTTPSETNLSCQTAIKAYLDKADLKWRWEKAIKEWDNITVDYVGRLNDSEIFDTSVESIAQACGKYASGRNYSEWLAFSVWGGQMIPGFDKWVIGMKIWQTKTITIPAKDAYGEWTKDKLITVEKSQIPNAQQYQVWMQVVTDYWQVFKVYEVKDKEIVFDANHELAGKDLIFDITIKEIK